MITTNYPADKIKDLKMSVTKDGSPLAIPHYKIIDLVVKELEFCKFCTGKVRMAISNADRDMLATIEVFPPDCTLASNQRMWIGITNSFEGRRTSVLYGCIEHNKVGVACERYIIKKPRGTNYDRGLFPISEQIDTFVVQCGNFHNRVREMQYRWLSIPDQDILLVEAARVQIIAWKYLWLADKYMRLEGKRETTAWQFYQGVMRAVCDKHPPLSVNPRSDLLHRMFELRRLVMEGYGHAKYGRSVIRRPAV